MAAGALMACRTWFSYRVQAQGDIHTHEVKDYINLNQRSLLPLGHSAVAASPNQVDF